jgi:hypothetical protein
MDKVHYVKYTKSSNIEGVICTFYDKNKKIMFSSKVEIIGKLYKEHNLWVWAWAIPLLDRSIINTIKSIFIYAVDIYTNSKNSMISNDNIVLKQNLLNSRLLVNNKIQIDIYCALSSYLSKIKLIYELPPLTYKYYTSEENPLLKRTITDKFKDITDKKNLSGVYYFIHDPPDI